MTPRSIQILCATALCLAVSTVAQAQTTAAPAKSAKPAATKAAAAPKAAAKPAAKSAAAAKTAKAPAKKASPTSSRTQLKTAAVNVAAGISAAEAALTPAELAIAERVYVGNLPCELGAFVSVARDPKSPGYFDVQVRNLKYRMSPVATSTGAIRLEDQKAGAVWLQILNKSMLMNHKLGQRLADECMGVEQQAINEVLKKNPARSVLEPEVPAAAK